MGFVSSGKVQDLKKFLMLASTYYSYSNDDGFGYVLQNGKDMIYFKDNGPAVRYWLNSNIDVIGNQLSFHCRIKASGGLDTDSAHPFVDKDRNIAIMHNGVINNYEDIKKELAEKGYKFNSDVDSEVLLWSYIEYRDDFIKKLEEKGVTGSIDLIIFDNGTIRVYSDGDNDFKYFIQDDIIYGASDDRVIRYLVSSSESIKTIEGGSIVSFKDGKIVDINNIGTVKKFNYAVTYGWNNIIQSHIYKFQDDEFSDEVDALDEKGEEATQLEIEPVQDSYGNTYTRVKTYEVFHKIIEMERIKDKFIDDYGDKFDSMEELLEFGSILTNAVVVIGSRGNKYNLKRRELGYLSTGSIVDYKNGGLYESLEEYREFARRWKKSEDEPGEKSKNNCGSCVERELQSFDLS
jgi:hypothetical protein